MMPKFSIELYRNVCQTKTFEIEAEDEGAANKIVNEADDAWEKYWKSGWEDDSVRESMISHTLKIR